MSLDSYMTDYYGYYLMIFGVVYLVILALGIFSLVCTWKVFKKAGKKGWESIVPIYNMVVLLEISGCSVWFIFLLLIPYVNFIVIFYIYYKLGKKFGQSTGFCIGLMLLTPIFMAILAFDKSKVYENQLNNNMNNQPQFNQMQYNSQNMNNFQPVNNNQFTNNQPQFSNNQYNNQQMLTKVCPKCGTMAKEDSSFCMNCGNQL